MVKAGAKEPKGILKRVVCDEEGTPHFTIRG